MCFFSSRLPSCVNKKLMNGLVVSGSLHLLYGRSAAAEHACFTFQLKLEKQQPGDAVAVGEHNTVNTHLAAALGRDTLSLHEYGDGSTRT